MRTISIRIEFDSLVEDGSYDAVETCRLMSLRHQKQTQV